MREPFFVDCHSHVVPSGDDGVGTVGEGLDLCAEAARRGTRVLFATPHVWPHLPLPPEREAEIRSAYAAMADRAALELRLGYELTPTPHLLEDDPRRYRLDGTDIVLMEVPFGGPLDDLLALAEHVESAGLRPLVAHPERGDAVQADPEWATRLAERGWLLQINSSSLLGRHGRESQDLAWGFIEDGLATVVASDGHRPTRPPHLDEAYARAVERLGPRARRLFDGSALGLSSPASAPRAGEVALPGA